MDSSKQDERQVDHNAGKMEADKVNHEDLGQSLERAVLDATQLLALFFRQTQKRAIPSSRCLPAQIWHWVQAHIAIHRKGGADGTERVLDVASHGNIRTLSTQARPRTTKTRFRLIRFRLFHFHTARVGVLTMRWMIVIRACSDSLTSSCLSEVDVCSQTVA